MDTGNSFSSRSLVHKLTLKDKDYLQWCKSVSRVSYASSSNMLKTCVHIQQFPRHEQPKVDGGIVLPDKASLHLTTIEDSKYKEDKIEFWNSVYGFDMSCIKKKAMMEPNCHR